MTTPVGNNLIEVSIPLEAINVASAREKSIRHGHPSPLHLWCGLSHPRRAHTLGFELGPPGRRAEAKRPEAEKRSFVAAELRSTGLGDVRSGGRWLSGEAYVRSPIPRRRLRTGSARLNLLGSGPHRRQRSCFYRALVESDRQHRARKRTFGRPCGGAQERPPTRR